MTTWPEQGVLFARCSGLPGSRFWGRDERELADRIEAGRGLLERLNDKGPEDRGPE